jgi:hypothetical protein
MQRQKNSYTEAEGSRILPQGQGSSCSGRSQGMLPQEHNKRRAQMETDKTPVQRKEVQGNSYTGYSTQRQAAGEVLPRRRSRRQERQQTQQIFFLDQLAEACFWPERRKVSFSAAGAVSLTILADLSESAAC